MKVVVHNGRCHADDVFAAATIQLKFGIDVEIMRTRDESQIESADLVFDVGGIYSPEKKRFDHHQIGGAGVRENGIPYAAFGLVWKEYGNDICGEEKIARTVDEKFVQPIDASDNGFPIDDPRENMPEEFIIDDIVKSFCPTWLEDESKHDAAFFEVLPFARRILERVISHASASVKGNKLAEDEYKNTPDPRLLVLDGPYPFGEVVEDHKEILFVVSPDVFADRWNVRAVQGNGFKNKKSLPKEWGGLREKELEEKTGIVGATFCHRGLHFCSSKTRDSALALAKLALG